MITVTALTTAGIGVGGCDGSTTEVARAVGNTTAPSPSGSASSRPSPSVDTNALLGRAKAASIAAKGLSALGVSNGPKEEKAVNYDVTAACGKRTDADRSDTHAAYNRTWSATGWWVSHTAYAYATAPATDVITQVKAAVGACTNYTTGEQKITLTGAVELPAYSGIDASYGYCLTTKRPDSTFVSCMAFLAKGSVVSTVWTVHGSSRPDNASGVKQVAAVAAEALKKATG